MITASESTGRPPKPRRRYYHYLSETSRYLFTHVRVPVWDAANGCWGKEMPYYDRETDMWRKPVNDEHLRYLYRLPEFINRADPWSPVYLTEGESDCDALRERGCIAVSYSTAALKFTEGQARWFTDCPNPVIICADRDPAGAYSALRRWESISTRVLGGPAAVTVVKPKRGNDVRDHLESYGPRSLVPVDLSALRAAAERSRPVRVSYGVGSGDWYWDPDGGVERVISDPAAWVARSRANYEAEKATRSVPSRTGRR